jgi:hypothetical protein
MAGNCSVEYLTSFDLAERCDSERGSGLGRERSALNSFDIIDGLAGKLARLSPS